MIYVHIMCSIYLLTCSNVGPLEDACAWLGGSPRKRQRVDSDGETHLKKLRAWANEWPTQERLVGTLEVFYDQSRWGLEVWVVGPSSAVSNTQKASSKVCSQALLWKNLICVVGHVVYFGAVTLPRQNIHIQSQGQGNSLVMSFRVVNFFQNYIYLEICDAFHKSADGISAHRASVRT